jgi:hypothetical protein
MSNDLIKLGDLPKQADIRRQTWEFYVTKDGREPNAYNSVGVKVVRWRSFDGWKWNYYLNVAVDCLKEPEKWAPVFNQDKESWRQFDYSNSLFHEIDFHGGVTYCKTNKVGGWETIEVGCDYSHYGDLDNMDDFHEEVFHDAVRSANQFLAMNPLKEPATPSPA